MSRACARRDTASGASSPWCGRTGCGACSAPPVSGVWVRYPAKDDQVVHSDDDSLVALRGVSLDIHPGEVVAFVGPSGSGKTTLVNLLPRFVEIERGDILLDGVALADWNLTSLRRQYAMVSQDVVMLNDPLPANPVASS